MSTNLENNNDNNEEEKSKCLKFLELNLSKNIKILSLLKGIESLGCQLPQDFFACKKCEDAVGGNGTRVTGGFRSPVPGEADYKPQVCICIHIFFVYNFIYLFRLFCVKIIC